jgi:hypothetical protein
MNLNGFENKERGKRLGGLKREKEKKSYQVEKKGKKAPVVRVPPVGRVVDSEFHEIIILVIFQVLVPPGWLGIPTGSVAASFAG